jgi:serine/threonine-protein phosphatase 2A regulatory subunit B'
LFKKNEFPWILFSEREKMSQRDELWQQVEILAKNNPEWEKVIGQMQQIDLNTTEYDYIMNGDEELSKDKIEEMSREVSMLTVS